MNIIRSIAILFLSFVSSFAMASELPPNDANKHQLVVVGQPDAIPAKWFGVDPQLAKVKASTAYTLLSPNGGLFRERYQSTLGTDFPIVAYLRPDGGVIYFADRNNMPETPEKLFAEMKASVMMAKNAKPAEALPQDFATEDCPDGSCYPNQDKQPMFPALHPFKNPSPSNSLDVFDRTPVRDSISSGVMIVLTLVVLGVTGFFAIIGIGAMMVISRWIVP